MQRQRGGAGYPVLYARLYTLDNRRFFIQKQNYGQEMMEKKKALRNPKSFIRQDLVWQLSYAFIFTHRYKTQDVYSGFNWRFVLRFLLFDKFFVAYNKIRQKVSSILDESKRF